MKYIKTFESFPEPTEDELKKFEIKKGDYVITNDTISNIKISPYFIHDLLTNEIGQVKSIFISNKGNKNESIYCGVIYTNIPNHISKHISGNPSDFEASIEIKNLIKVTPEEYKEYKLKKDIKKYNL